MNAKVKESLINESTQPDNPKRQPYEKPQVIYRAPLEAMAALCGGSTPPGKTGPSGSCSITFS